MPGPSNTLLIEGSFSELADELAQYLDTVSKVEASSGVQNEVSAALSEIREKEQAEEPADPSSIQRQKDEVLKKIVGKAGVLNTAPEKGKSSPIRKRPAMLTKPRVRRRLQSCCPSLKSVACSRHVSGANMHLPHRSSPIITDPKLVVVSVDHSYYHLQHPPK